MATIVALAATPTSAQQPAPVNELLGLSRYLPVDVDTYASVLEMARLRQTIAESQAWRKVAAMPEAAAALAQLEAGLEQKNLPPPVQMGLELLKAAGSSEITLAARPDVSQNILSLGRLIMLSVALFAPTRHAPDSPQAAALEAKRGPLRQQWAATIGKIQVPSLVAAVRIREPAKFQPFVQMALEQGRRALLQELGRGAPPELVAVLDKSFSETTYGRAKLHRFHLRIGDVLPRPLVQQALQQSPLGEAERIAAADTLENLTFNLHVGFVGEYLLLASSSDDEFVRGIVERQEGREPATLAAAEAFAPIRRELKPGAIGVLFADASESQAEIRRNLLPLLNTLLDPELLELLGAPAELTPTLRRFAANIETAVFDAPVRQQAVIHVDRGLRQFMQSEYERDPIAAPTAPLVTLKSIPATAIGHVTRRDVSLEPLWEQVRYLITEQRTKLNARAKQLVGDPDGLKNALDEMAKFDGLLKPIDEKLSPSLQGETSVVLGEFVKFGVRDESDMPIRDLPVPSAAIIMRSPAPDQAIAGLRELFDALLALAPPQEAGAPVKLAGQSIDGLDVWSLAFKGVAVDGVEPHFARVGDDFVISSSLELTKRIRDAATGTSPALASTPNYQALKEYLPGTALQLSYLDGAALVRNARSSVDALLGLLEKNGEQLGFSRRDVQQLADVKQYVEVGFQVASMFRGAVSSIVGEARTDVLREWIWLEDLQP